MLPVASLWVLSSDGRITKAEPWEEGHCMEALPALQAPQVSRYGLSVLSELQPNQQIRKFICPDSPQQRSPLCLAPQFLAEQ